MTLYDTRAALLCALALLVAGTGLADRSRAGDGDAALRDLPQLACRLQVPTAWVDAPAGDAGGARFRDPASGLAAEVSALSPRRDLADLEERLAAAARGAGLAPAEPARTLTVDGRRARRLLLEGEILGAGVRQLVVLVDAPLRTYVVMIGAPRDGFDVALADRVAASLERTGGAGSAADPVARPRWGCAPCAREWPESQRFCGECGAKTAPLK